MDGLRLLSILILDIRQSPVLAVELETCGYVAFTFSGYKVLDSFIFYI